MSISEAHDNLKDKQAHENARRQDVLSYGFSNAGLLTHHGANETLHSVWSLRTWLSIVAWKQVFWSITDTMLA